MDFPSTKSNRTQSKSTSNRIRHCITLLKNYSALSLSNCLFHLYCYLLKDLYLVPFEFLFDLSSIEKMHRKSFQLLSRISFLIVREIWCTAFHFIYVNALANTMEIFCCISTDNVLEITSIQWKMVSRTQMVNKIELLWWWDE